MNMANILGKLPYEIRIAILRQAPVDFLIKWIAKSEPRFSVNLLSSLQDRIIVQAEDLKVLRKRIVEAICIAVSESPPKTLHQIPRRLFLMKVSNNEFSLLILREILGRVYSGGHWGAIRRIIWDVHQFCDALSEKAIDVGFNLITTNYREIPNWELLCIAGIVELSRPGTTEALWSKVSPTKQNFLKYSREQKRDRWQIFLAAIGFASQCAVRECDISQEILRSVVSLYDSTNPPFVTEASQKLMKALVERVGIEAQVT